PVVGGAGAAALGRGAGRAGAAGGSMGFGGLSETAPRAPIGPCGPAGDADPPQEVLAGQMRRLPPRLADAEIDRRLAKIDRHQLAVDVRDVQKRDVADAVELEKLGFGEALLRGGAAERPEPVAGRDRRGGRADLKPLP